MKKSFSIILFVTFMSCGHQKGTTHNNTVDHTIMNEQLQSFTVSFISKGSGTDQDARKNYDLFLTDFEERNNMKLVYEKVYWGMEGETDYCFDMGDIDPTVQASFIAESKEVLKDSKLVRYAENKPCREPRIRKRSQN